MGRIWLAVAAAAVVATGCSSGDRSPEGAAKAFVKTVRSMEPSRVFKLLAPQSQKALKKRAEEATRHTGGRQGLKPEEMIIVGLAKAEAELKQVEVVSDDGKNAVVRLIGRKGKVTEQLKLVKVDDHWKVILSFD